MGGLGGGRLYTYRYTVTTRMTPALRWAAMRAILMFDNCEGQCHKTMSTDHNFLRERRAEAVSNRDPSAYQPNALPLVQTGSLLSPGTRIANCTINLLAGLSNRPTEAQAVLDCYWFNVGWLSDCPFCHYLVQNLLIHR